jgi:hypothetical protein
MYPQRPLRILDAEYRTMKAPHALTDDAGTPCDHQIDHEDRVIWTDPSLSPDALLEVIPSAVCQAWQERLSHSCRNWLSTNHVPIPVLESTEQPAL